MATKNSASSTRDLHLEEEKLSKANRSDATKRKNREPAKFFDKKVKNESNIKSSKESQIKLLSDLVEIMAGEGNGRIVNILFGRRDVNEFNVSKKMNLTINQVRNILYKLSAGGLVTFIRKKDKRKGWYIYYWTLESEKCFLKLEQALVSRIKELTDDLGNRETKRYYYCKFCDIEATEEKALEDGFTCSECAEVYTLRDNTNAIKEAKAKITKTEKDLEMIRGELEQMREKERKKTSRKEKSDKKKGKKKKVKKSKPKKAPKKISKKVKRR